MHKTAQSSINKTHGKCVKRASLIPQNAKGLFIAHTEATTDWEKRCHLISHTSFVS